MNASAVPDFGGVEADTLALLRAAFAGTALAGRLPRVKALHLPPRRPPSAMAGESCAVELEGGALGLSYVLFGDTLAALREAAPACAGADALQLAAGYAAPPAQDRGTPRTLGLAAVNALTAWLFMRAGYMPPDAGDSLAAIDPRPGDRIGMIGWFPPLVPRITAAGAALVVIELREDLIGEREGVTVTADAAALASCNKVLATGTLLLNGTLARMRAAAPQAERFALVGPSAGSLPDPLFARRISALGGSWVEDGPAYIEALASGDKRSGAARKVALRAGSYPGLPALLARL
ncbi:conserved hypothetical protein [Rubrivivax sp. A210]|uniref:Rossmann-like domain-containing protein n=1 Tax=Rubrivivax sp. A210 TaxID=2772301 RepID=UPI00191A56E3|nr:DUF364 domain-containing protein [Rubrivivax sp. A210]CAD5373878.1 conserved hypothetical protein [Rubrivivax sp. A210]